MPTSCSTSTSRWRRWRNMPAKTPAKINASPSKRMSLVAKPLPLIGPSTESHFTVAREMRNLAHLNTTAASHRVLNLSKIWLLNQENEDYLARPMFENSGLNRAIILKHTLRMDERHLFGPGRTTVTKIVLPFDARDLSLGGRSFFFRQMRFEELMSSFLGID